MTEYEVTLDAALCAGFGNCSLTAPSVFGFDDDAMIGTVVRDRVGEAEVFDVRLAEADCPARAIKVSPRSG